MEFKVGDKLYARKSGGNHTEGRTYEVIEIEHDNFVYIHITGDRENACIREEVMPRFFRRVSEVPQADQSGPRITKISLTQEQAEAIETALEKYNYDAAEMLDIHARIKNYDKYHYAGGLEALSELSVADLARALLIGYEVEQTAEEKVLVAYEAAKRMLNAESRKDEKSYESGFWWGKVNGMKSVLDAYGITVKGINN